MIDIGYQQINIDHTMFYWQYGGYTMMLVVHVDDMIFTGNDKKEIAQLKMRLGKEFEVKDLEQFKYFFGIEVARGVEGIVLS
jgi:Reverse transcriptase (RNA-dependent DNA polymerase)